MASLKIEDDQQEKLKALKRRLASDFRGELSGDLFARTLYATDASLYQKRPLLVAVPREPEDLEVLVAACRQCEVSLVPRGGGTSLAGQAVGAGVAVDMSKYLNRLLRVVPEERWAEVEPGLVLGQLEAALRPHGLMFAPSPATSEYATVGGALGNNASGVHSVLYGKTVDHVEAVTFLCGLGELHQFRELDRQGLERLLEASGRTAELVRKAARWVKTHGELIASRYPKILRRVSGYNLDELLRGLRAVGWEVPPFAGQRAPLAPPVKGFHPSRLLVGSEGTLGLLTRARLHLVPRPKARGVLVSHYRSLREALLGNAELLETGPAASELMDEMLLTLARVQRGIAPSMGFLEGQPRAVLITEYFGDSPAEVSAKLSLAARRLQLQGLSYASPAFVEPATIEQIWRVRKAGLPLLLGKAGDRKPIAFVEDTAVDPSRLVEYVERFEALVREHGTTAAYYAHASVGCLHIRPLLDLRQSADVERLESLSSAVSDLVLEFGGSMSGEHGDGWARGQWNEKLFGSVLYQVFREVKQLFDPEGLLNPSKVVDAPPLKDNLRQLQPYRSADVSSELDWSREGGLVRAAELCNGAGLCRKTERATMCPSFMVTRDEEHSTRGRANLLRAVLTGHLPEAELYGSRLRQAFDLCLECKACKSECPSNVDVAKMKFEVLSGYFKHHRVPLRTQLFARADLVARFGSALAPVSNWVLSSPLKTVVSHILGIAPERDYPTFARQNFWDWWRRHERRRPEPSQPRVVLFVDTFHGYNEPWVAQAAVTVLERLGYAVTIADRTCCGRPMISKGLSDLARRHALDNLNRLRRFVADDIPIVGLEPSCLSALRDDYPSLIDDPDLEPLSRLVVSFEEFLQDKSLPLVEGAPPLLFHAHCHEKALVGSGPALRLLGQLPGLDLREVDSGCCGMAGSFGYEKEHFELSKALAQRRLQPAAEATHRGGGRVVTSGFSCRQQVRFTTGKAALHPAEVIAAHLQERRQ